MPPCVIPLTGSGNDGSFDFNGQIALKSSVKFRVSDRKGSGGTASFVSFIGETTQEDGNITVTGLNYSWQCNAGSPAIPDTWVPASQMGGNPYYNYNVFVPGKPAVPAGTIEITINWDAYSPPPENTQLPEGETQETWLSKKVVIDQGIWVNVHDDHAQTLKTLKNKMDDIIDTLVSTEDDAERVIRDKIWESVRKYEGYFPYPFTSLIIPGEHFLTSYDRGNKKNWNCRLRRIVFGRSAQSEICQYHIKEQY
ncbi:MAG TPA: hypothetical protein PLQ61_06850 [Bacteroidales bacterium]|nr:hypothetical protein [Petrotogaceae bacterium]HQJ20895.1 hypothetical protein [Bacteroidales bacterium]